MNIMQFSFQMIRDRYVFLIQWNSTSIHTILFGHFFITGTLIGSQQKALKFCYVINWTSGYYAFDGHLIGN